MPKFSDNIIATVVEDVLSWISTKHSTYELSRRFIFSLLQQNTFRYDDASSKCRTKQSVTPPEITRFWPFLEPSPIAISGVRHVLFALFLHWTTSKTQQAGDRQPTPNITIHVKKFNYPFLSPQLNLNEAFRYFYNSLLCFPSEAGVYIQKWPAGAGAALPKGITAAIETLKRQ